jgi:hypothetical protein
LLPFFYAPFSPILSESLWGNCSIGIFGAIFKLFGVEVADVSGESLKRRKDSLTAIGNGGITEGAFKYAVMNVLDM